MSDGEVYINSKISWLLSKRSWIALTQHKHHPFISADVLSPGGRPTGQWCFCALRSPTVEEQGRQEIHSLKGLLGLPKGNQELM
jgi:hypothetical protein